MKCRRCLNRVNDLNCNKMCIECMGQVTYYSSLLYKNNNEMLNVFLDYSFNEHEASIVETALYQLHKGAIEDRITSLKRLK